jgi:hypothetical protein
MCETVRATAHDTLLNGFFSNIVFCSKLQHNEHKDFIE